ncbi:adenylate isopentenyltransferase [Canna indica]|uniref:Adenylate isopentenyltransferase n=1 Tax=Canna indica TaxID=4628 RepID=A0AAQ3PY93_9LILI|nr:adenylate isopentenyltransferase [Canna indica]
MKILLIRGSNTVLLPYLHRPASATVGATPKQNLRLEQYNRRYSPEHYRLEDNDGGEIRKQSVVVVMGATGTGKSKLSVELATRFFGEVVNSDKTQVYRNLDITTNKMPIAERCSIPHHLLGEFDPAVGELQAAEFREMAARAISGIANRGRLPVVAGGSNSFIHAAMASSYDPGRSPFGIEWRRRGWKEDALRYRCCFLWVDVEPAALAEQLDRRVEEMMAAGMVEELAQYFAAEAVAEAGESRHPGLGKAIGVAEFREYFRGKDRGTSAAYKAAVATIKANTRRLAEEQVRKIERLGEMGWPLRRLNGTGTVKARLAGAAAEAEAAWKRDVAEPSGAIVQQFLKEERQDQHHHMMVSSPLIYT